MSHPMRFSVRSRILPAAIAAALALALLIASPGSSASADDTISGSVPIEVTNIDGTVPLLIDGTVVILNEEAVSTAPVTTFNSIPGFESLDMHFRQSSSEQFTTTDFATARSTSGTASGTLTASSRATGAQVASGSYDLSMSTTPECQMKGNGTWSMDSDKFTVSGAVQSCVNWDPSIEKFTGSVDVQGDLVMKQQQQKSGGLIRRVLGGLFG